MAEIDTSIYGNIAKPNPLDMLGDITKLSTDIAGNKLLRMQLLGKQKLGQDVQGAIDPDTGDINPAALLKKLHDDPGSYAAAAEGAPLALSMTGAKIANQTASQSLMDAGFHTLGNALGAHLAQTKGPVNPKEIEKIVVDLASQGRINPMLGLAFIKGIPDDPNATRAYAEGGFLQTLSPEAAAGEAPATPTAEGAPRVQTRGQFISQSMGGDTPTGGVVTGLSPAAGAALPESGKNYAALANNLTNLGNQVPDRLALLTNMETDLPEFTAGPVSDRLKSLVAGTNELFGTKFNLEGVAAQERFDKLSNQIALAQSGALGVTDLTTRTAMGANPNSNMSNLGIKGNIALLKGNEDAIRVKSTAWQQAQDGGVTPEKFGTWSSTFNKMYDPRVFQSVYLTPADRAKMNESLSKDERDKFRARYNFAVKNGWIPDPRTPPAPVGTPVDKPAGFNEEFQ